jgi:hypothetical protein
MSDFPAIAPSQISYDLGRLNISEVQTFGGPIRFRHSLQVNGNSFGLRYTGLNQATIEIFRQHYLENGGTHNYFEVPAAAWGEYAAVSSSSVYRYAEPPVESHEGLYYNLDISLRITTGTNLLYILAGGTASNRTVFDSTQFASLAFTGTAPFTLNAGTADPLSPEATLILQGGGASQ